MTGGKTGATEANVSQWELLQEKKVEDIYGVSRSDL